MGGLRFYLRRENELITDMKKWLLIGVICMEALLFTSCATQTRLQLDPTFVSQSDIWDAQFKKGLASFGPYKTIAVNKLDSPKYKKKSVESGMLFSRRSVTKEEKEFYRLLFSNGTDTATALLSVTSSFTSESPSLFKQLRGKDTPEDYRLEHNPNDLNGSIQLQNGTSPWEYVLNLNAPKQGFSTTDSISSRYLRNKTTRYEVRSRINITTNFNQQYMARVPYTGFVLEDHEGKEVAAVQVRGRKHIWFSRQLPSENRTVIACFFAIILESETK